MISYSVCKLLRIADSIPHRSTGSYCFRPWLRMSGNPDRCLADRHPSSKIRHWLRKHVGMTDLHSFPSAIQDRSWNMPCFDRICQSHRHIDTEYRPVKLKDLNKLILSDLDVGKFSAAPVRYQLRYRKPIFLTHILKLIAQSNECRASLITKSVRVHRINFIHR